MKKIIIVGGVAGGATAAARCRRLSEEDEIILFERDEYISFANCGLPYYIGNIIQDRNKLLVQTVEGMSQRFNLDIRNFSEVIKIDKENYLVKVRNVNTKEIYEETYDKLILSPGAHPIKIPIKGIDEVENIFTLRNIPDTDAIKAFVDQGSIKEAVIIGGGFIGLEMAENLTERGIHVTIIDLANQVMAPLDFEMAQMVHEELTNHGVTLLLEDSVTEFKNQGKTCILKSGKEISSDIIIMAIGVHSENQLAKDAEIKCGERGHILTTDQLQTIDEKTGEILQDIYAIGDAIEVHHYIDRSKTVVPLAWEANRQGHLVADHINGIDINYPGALGTAVAKVFDLTVATTGLNEKLLKSKKMDYQSIIVHRNNHASYYPDAEEISIKLLFNHHGKILGAQAIGGMGAEKRIDVIATAIRGNLTAQELPELELCYAPPYSSAKDPVNIAGYVASNIINNVYEMVYYDEIDEIVKTGGYLIDVRTAQEFNLGHIEGAINIPVDELRERIDEIEVPKSSPIYVNCQVGLRAYIAARILQGYGYKKVYNLSGGYKTYYTAFQHPNEVQPYTDKNINIQKLEEEDPPKQKNEKTIEVDACGLQCPGPIMKTYHAINKIAEGDLLYVQATDPGYARDIKKWCQTTGNTLINVEKKDRIYHAYIRKGNADKTNLLKEKTNDKTTIVLFSGDMDKAMAAMIIAQGSASMGKEVTVFCTFWGLNLLRKDQSIAIDKSPMEKIFGKMMPRGPKNMGISKMNYLGLGAKMMRRIMRNKKVDSLDVLVKSAKFAGVQFIACTMSMDVMGIKKEELIDEIDYAGVATYLAESETAGITLFI